MHDDPGLLAGRYRLLGEIARGGMAAVWEAEDTLLGRRVAIKILHSQFATDPEFLERFRREARSAAQLSHPGIVAVFDVGEGAPGQAPYIVMQLIEGESLKDRVRKSGPLAANQVASIGAAIADALEYAHRRGVIHRDVKPQNVLLGDDERARLTDFGIAQAISASGLTRAGTVMGSVHYLAPELIRGLAATPQSDIYGLGASLYEAATGQVPFTGDTDVAIALAHVEQPPVPPRQLNPAIDAGLEATILRALAKKPDLRFGSAAEMQAALSGAASGATARFAVAPGPPVEATRTVVLPRPSSPSARQVAPRTRTVSPARRGASNGLLALLLVLAVVLVALGVGFFGLASRFRGPASPEPSPTVTLSPSPTALPIVPPSPSPTRVPPTATATEAPSPTASPTPTVAPTATQTPTPPIVVPPASPVSPVSPAPIIVRQ